MLILAAAAARQFLKYKCSHKGEDMATYSKEFLSGSTNGKHIKVTQTATAGDTIHTCPEGTAYKDEIYIYATNMDTVARELTIEWGGVSSPDDLLKVSIPAKSGDILVIAGKPLNNSLVVKAFAAAANVINISGFVNRITA